jgi:hypothetical protein
MTAVLFVALVLLAATLVVLVFGLGCLFGRHGATAAIALLLVVFAVGYLLGRRRSGTS